MMLVEIVTIARRVEFFEMSGMASEAKMVGLKTINVYDIGKSSVYTHPPLKNDLLLSQLHHGNY